MTPKAPPPKTTSISLRSPAKLNLFLHINERRADGYHELQTYFQLIDYCDTLHFHRRDDDRTIIHTDIEGLASEDNLITKAVRSFNQHSGLRLGFDITLDKRIPMGGGLGGGSSNAATAMLAANWFAGLPLSLGELSSLGATLGADIPVFLFGQSAHAQGIGEHLQVAVLDPAWYLIVQPRAHCDTAGIFSDERLTRDTPKMKIAPAFDRAKMRSLANDCERVVRSRHPTVAKTLDWLQQFQNARLTGTGCCCFCEFDSESEARAAYAKAKELVQTNNVISVFVAKALNTSPVWQQLDCQH